MLFSSAAALAVECDPFLGLPLEQTQLAALEEVTSSQSQSECLDESHISGNRSSGTPEKQIKRMMSELSDEEVFVRLIMAETLASTCPSQAVAQGIAWVIKNRVDARNASRFGLGREVAFKDYQFRSSTGSCDVAKRSVFMCPTSANNQELYDMARAAYRETQNGTNPLSGAYQYFFFKHFDRSTDCARWRGITPDWATASREKNPSNLRFDRSCIKFYR